MESFPDADIRNIAWHSLTTRTWQPMCIGNIVLCKVLKTLKKRQHPIAFSWSNIVTSHNVGCVLCSLLSFNTLYALCLGKQVVIFVSIDYNEKHNHEFVISNWNICNLSYNEPSMVAKKWYDTMTGLTITVYSRIKNIIFFDAYDVNCKG